MVILRSWQIFPAKWCVSLCNIFGRMSRLNTVNYFHENTFLAFIGFFAGSYWGNFSQWFLNCQVPRTFMKTIITLNFMQRNFGSHLGYYLENRKSTIANRKLLMKSWMNYMSRLMTKPTKWHVRPAKTQISLGIHPVWSESSLCAWWVAFFMRTVKTLLGSYAGWGVGMWLRALVGQIT